MAGPSNIDSWFEFIVWSIIAVAALAGAVQSWRGRREHRKQSATIEEVREQVSNTHDTNLRDDIDRLIDAVDRIDSKQDAHGTTLSKFMREMYAATARQDRIAAKYHPEEP
ncbi:DUF2746 domain-containing protein [Gordonia sp. (in: high G+C Gram-positive bacteria)]|uniref:DUF2746 domain-containing protein n=1 Tax=Gordonia sp. (in: high G+C Gram-positive bacteria) TaxID=84139 RepID=UPI003C777D24